MPISRPSVLHRASSGWQQLVAGNMRSRSGRSCPTAPSPTAAPAMPTWLGYRPPSHRRQGAARRAGSRARLRTRPPRSAHRRTAGPPSATAPGPIARWPAPAVRPALPRCGRPRPRCGALVRVDTDHDRRDPPIIKQMGPTAVGTPDSKCELLPSFEPHRGGTPAAAHFGNRKPGPRAGRQFVSNDRQRSTDATSSPAATSPTQSGSSGAFIRVAVRWPVAVLRCGRTGPHGRPGRTPLLARQVPWPRVARRGIQAGHQ
jgi:hypothetical protein